MRAPSIVRGAVFLRSAALAGLSAALLALPGAAAARSYMVGSFDSVAVRGDVTVEMVSGGAPGAVADGSPDDLDRLTINRSGQRVTISMAPAPRTGARRAAPVTVRLSARAVSRIAVEGSGRVRLDRLAGREARVALAGPGYLEIGTAEADRLFVSVIGSGKVVIAGGASDNADMTLSGAATLDAPAFTTDRLAITLSGASEASIAVDEIARIGGGGAGKIVIGGGGDCIVEAAGTLSIDCPGFAPRR
mgnify:CR=1 FL=1